MNIIVKLFISLVTSSLIAAWALRFYPTTSIGVSYPAETAIEMHTIYITQSDTYLTYIPFVTLIALTGLLTLTTYDKPVRHEVIRRKLFHALAYSALFLFPAFSNYITDVYSSGFFEIISITPPFYKLANIPWILLAIVASTALYLPVFMILSLHVYIVKKLRLA